MEKLTIRLIQDVAGMKIGTVKTIPSIHAKTMISNGVAELADAKKTNKKVQEPKED